MEAAAHGHSTLGIPAKVGKDFVAADAAKSVSKGSTKPMRKIAKVPTVTTPALSSKRAPAVQPPKSSVPTTVGLQRPVARPPKMGTGMMPGEEDLPQMHTSKHH